MKISHSLFNFSSYQMFTKIYLPFHVSIVASKPKILVFSLWTTNNLFILGHPVSENSLCRLTFSHMKQQHLKHLFCWCRHSEPGPGARDPRVHNLCEPQLGMEIVTNNLYKFYPFTFFNLIVKPWTPTQFKTPFRPMGPGADTKILRAP